MCLCSWSCKTATSGQGEGWSKSYGNWCSSHGAIILGKRWNRTSESLLGSAQSFRWGYWPKPCVFVSWLWWSESDNISARTLYCFVIAIEFFFSQSNRQGPLPRNWGYMRCKLRELVIVLSARTHILDVGFCLLMLYVDLLFIFYKQWA